MNILSMGVVAAGAWIMLMCAAAHAEDRPQRYILDTDIASDCDDAGAVAMVNTLIDRSELDVLAMMVSTGGDDAAPALCAINTWYGHGDIPIGTLKDPTFWVGGSPDQPAGAHNFVSYNRYLAQHYPTRITSGQQAPDAVALYRQVLAKQPDHSVTIQTIGPLPNLFNLMHSQADQFSPMTGMELIRAKVRRLVITGGRNPEGTSSNFSKMGAGKYTRTVIEQWPTRIEFVGNEIGSGLHGDWSENAEANVENPARMAYVQFYKGNAGRKHHILDQCGVLYVVRGEGEIFGALRGKMTCDDRGHTQWQTGEKTEPARICVTKKPDTNARIVEQVEQLMTAGRKITPAAGD